MKAKGDVPQGHDALFAAFNSAEFARRVIVEICGGILGARDPLDHPSAYFVQEPNPMIVIEEGKLGVNFVLSMVSRGNRTSKMFQTAVSALHKIVREAVAGALQPGEKCEVFTLICLDGQVEVATGQYSTLAELGPEWVEGPKE